MADLAPNQVPNQAPDHAAEFTAASADGPALVLVRSNPPGAPMQPRDGRRGRPATRPGLPTDPTNAWNRAVTLWTEHLTAHLNTTGVYTRGLISRTELANYAKRVGWLAGDHSEQSPWSLTAHDLAEWLDRQTSWSMSTRRQVITAARNFYAWATRAGLCQRSPLAGVSVTSPQPPGPARADLPAAWATALAEWQIWLRGGARTEPTIRTRSDHVANLARLHADPWSVTEGDLARWLSRADLAPATKRTMRASARSFYSWAIRAGHLASDPASDLDPIRQRRALPRPTPTDVLRNALGSSDDRLTLMIELAMYAGLRRAEIAGAHTRDVGETSLLVRGKGGNERSIPLHPALAAALRAELQRRRDGVEVGRGWGLAVPPADGWLFPARNTDLHLSPRWVGKMIGTVLGPGWTTHTIRHRFATQAYQIERDLRATQELLGHSKPETTARYAAVPDGALRTAVLGVGL